MDSGTVTALLVEWKQGDELAGERLFTVLYDHLHRLAAAKMRRERSGHTLQPTALVHEAFLRLQNEGAVPASDRGHFLAIAGRVMGRVLTDSARERLAQKRGGGELAVTLDPELAGDASDAIDVLWLAEVLQRLAAMDPRKADIVRLRYLCGATVTEVAEALGLSERTVKREWAFSKAWMLRELGR